MPFWMSNEALGDPIGNFSGYRLVDGTIAKHEDFNYKSVPEFLNQFIVEGTDSLRRDYLRIKSRQTFTYGVAYHLTGNEQYLDLARLGVEYLLANGGYETGSPVTYWQEGDGRPDRLQRNSQDLAYSLTGLTFYYYLTRDPQVLETILSVKDYIFNEYYYQSTLTEKPRLFMWVREDFEQDLASAKELVAQLDQLNAYLLLITPMVPDKLKNAYEQDLKNICYLIKENFYDEELNLFWGSLNDKSVEQNHTDFGHTIKTLWMFYQVGKMVDDRGLRLFAEEKARALLNTAFIEERGSWAGKYRDSSIMLDKGNIWWMYAELDQMCATLSLKDISLYTRYLARTYDYWEEHFIDKKYGEAWFALSENEEVIDIPFKSVSFKNGYHTLEHALVGHISTMNYLNEETVLYYAFLRETRPETSEIRAYYFEGEVKKMTESKFNNPEFKKYRRAKVVFENVN